MKLYESIIKEQEPCIITSFATRRIVCKYLFEIDCRSYFKVVIQKEGNNSLGEKYWEDTWDIEILVNSREQITEVRDGLNGEAEMFLQDYVESLLFTEV